MRAQRIYVLAALAALTTVGIGYITAGRLHQELIYNSAGVVAALALFRHSVMRRSEERGGWLWLFAGTTALAAGDVLYFHHASFFGTDAGFPSIADYFYLAAYPLLVVGLGSFIRRRKGGLATAIDAAMFATTAGVLVWAFIIDPVADQSSLPLAARVVSLAYPAASVLLVAMTCWLALVPGGRSGRFRWLIAAYGLNFGASAVYARQSIDGTYLAGTWLDLGWIFSYLCVAAAVLTPLAVDKVASHNRRIGPPVGRRISILATTLLLGPGVVLVARARGIDLDMSELALGCLLLFLLVLGRMGLLARALDRQRSLLDAKSEDLANAVTRLTEAQADRKRLLEDIMNAGDSERVALARELHDGPIQQLSTLTFETDLALMSLAEGKPGEAAATIRSLQDGLTNQINNLRDLMSSLRPPALDERGLADAVRDHMRSFSARTRIRTTFTSDLDVRLDPGIEMILYRVVQESLINTGKHAGASHVGVTLTSTLSDITLSVADDGIGFDASNPEAVYKEGHLGLVSMRERVEMAGGKLRIRAQESEGTTIQVTIPASGKVPQSA